MLLGEALRGGEGYRDIWLPEQPRHVKYPPFYPGILAALGLAGGVQLFKLASLLFTTAAVGLTALVGKTLVGPRGALLAAGAVALNPTLLEYSHYVLSEAAFTVLVMTTLLLAARALPGLGEGAAPADGHGTAAERSTLWFALAIAAAAAAFLTRTAGLVLLAALPLAALSSGRWRRGAAAAAAGAGVAAAWAFYQRLAVPDAAGYLGQLVMRNPYDPAAGRVDLAGLAARAATNAWRYVSEVVPDATLGTQTAAGQGGGGLALFGIALGGLALAGWAMRAMKRIALPELFALLYVGLIVVWPDVWTDRRFLLPVLPLVVLYAVRGGGALSARLGRAGRWVPIGLAAVLVVAGVRAEARLVPLRIDCMASYRAGSPCDPPAMASFYEAARWARDHTPAEAVVANRKPSLFYWFGRRRGDLYPYSGETELVIRGLEQMGARYVVVDQISGTTIRYLVPAIQQHRDRFLPLHQTGDPPTLVFEFVTRPVTAMAPLRGDAP